MSTGTAPALGPPYTQGGPPFTQAYTKMDRITPRKPAPSLFASARDESSSESDTGEIIIKKRRAPASSPTRVLPHRAAKENLCYVELTSRTRPSAIASSAATRLVRRRVNDTQSAPVRRTSSRTRLLAARAARAASATAASHAGGHASTSTSASRADRRRKTAGAAAKRLASPAPNVRSLLYHWRKAQPFRKASIPTAMRRLIQKFADAQRDAWDKLEAELMVLQHADRKARDRARKDALGLD